MRRLHADRASIADACAYTMFRMAGDAPACRLWRRLLQCTMNRDLHELRRCMPPTLRDVSVCVNPYATCRGECVGGGQIFFWRKKVFRRKSKGSAVSCVARGRSGEKGRERHLKRGRGGEERGGGMLVHAAAWQQDAARMPAQTCIHIRLRLASEQRDSENCSRGQAKRRGRLRRIAAARWRRRAGDRA